MGSNPTPSASDQAKRRTRHLMTDRRRCFRPADGNRMGTHGDDLGRLFPRAPSPLERELLHRTAGRATTEASPRTAEGSVASGGDADLIRVGQAVPMMRRRRGQAGYREVRVRRVPVSARGDRGRGAPVPAVRAVLPARRGAAGRAGHRRGPRHGAPVGAGTLYAAGMQRFLDSLSTYSRRRLTQAQRPDVDRIDHLPPALALRQRPPGSAASSSTPTRHTPLSRPHELSAPATTATAIPLRSAIRYDPDRSRLRGCCSAWPPPGSPT